VGVIVAVVPGLLGDDAVDDVMIGPSSRCLSVLSVFIGVVCVYAVVARRHVV
jgi:hypothetical protein